MRGRRFLVGALGLLLALSASLSCNDDSPDPEVERLLKACMTRVCPDPKPNLIDCMPIIPKDMQPLCEPYCTMFFESCGIDVGI